MRIALLALVVLLAAASAARGDPAARLAPGSRPAPGLGGDPFAPGVRGFPGWEGLAAGTATSGAGVVVDVSEPLPRDGASGFEWRRRAWRSYLSRDRVVGPRRYLVALERSRPDWSSSLRSAMFSFRGDAERDDQVAAVGFEELVPGLTLGAHLGVNATASAATPVPWGAGARLAHGSRGAVTAWWARERTRHELEFGSQGERVGLVPVPTEERSGLSATAALAPVASVDVDLRRTRWLRAGRARSGDALDGDGVMESWQGSLRARPRDAIELLARRTEGRGGLEADASRDGLRFGRLSYLDGRVDSWLAGLSWRLGRHRLVADVERAALTVAARASVESWPFTDFLGDLLGGRGYALARAEVRGWRAHVAIERRTATGSAWRAGLHGYDLLPEASVVTWRPAFLVFGVVDRQEAVLDVARLQLAAISAGATFGVAGFELSADATQFVFARPVRHRSSAQAGAGEDAEGGGAQAPAASVAAARSWPGGTALSFAVRRPW